MWNRLQFWLRFSIFNLLLVALIGVVLRYKIAFSWPYFDQKHLHHGHSNLAFYGWITHTLYILLIQFLSKHIQETRIKKYHAVIILNLIGAYGMLLSFIAQGYGIYSISFIGLAVISSFWFGIKFFKDVKEIKEQTTTLLWFKSAIIFHWLSTIGTIIIVTMMMSHQFKQNIYLASEYFYLHFQYNGWFFFACMGLFHDKISNLLSSPHLAKKIYLLFAGSVIPAYLLSTLWLNLPMWIYILVVIAAFVQLYAWILLIKIIWDIRNDLLLILTKVGRYLFILSAICLTIKFILQLGSTIPYISTLAFGFRPIVIAYLHLVLLGVISLFILGYIYSFQYIKFNKMSILSVIFFAIGVFLNEFILMLQGVASFSYILIPYINESLLAAAIFMFLSMLLIFLSQWIKHISYLK